MRRPADTWMEASMLVEVKQIDLLTYLKATNPGRLKKINHSTYCLTDHDSLKISRGKWCWWSHGGIGGRSAIDFLVKVDGMKFLEAAWQVASDMGIINRTDLDIRTNQEYSEKNIDVKSEIKNFKLPSTRYPHEAISYLLSRGISQAVIDYFVEQKLILESYNKLNVIFLGRDEENIYRYGALRSILPDSDWKGEVDGSDKNYCFRYISEKNNEELHVFEGAIDMLSYATLYEADFLKMNLQSLGGIHRKVDQEKLPMALQYCLVHYPYIKKIYMHLDNDKAGILAASQIGTRLIKLGMEVIDEPPEGVKDINELLLLKKRWGQIK